MQSRSTWLRIGAILLMLASVGCQSLSVSLAQRFFRSDPPEIPAGMLAIRNIEFARAPSPDSDNGSRRLELDIYRAELPNTDKLPVVVYAFGGGWMSGDRNQIELLELLRLIDRGYALVTIDYRWTTEAIFPAQIHDVKAAIRWVRANAERQGFDPNRIAIMGASAGGHLAALAGTSGDIDELEGDLGTFSSEDGTAIGSEVQSVVDFFGPTDFTVYEAQHRENGLGNSNQLWFLDMLVGGPVAERPALVRQLNPIRYVDSNDPPTLIIHGDQDPTVPIQQSQLLAAALEGAGVDVSLRTIPGGNHGRSPEFVSAELFDEIVAFLDRTMPALP